MSDQNKNTGTAPSGTMNKPASTDNRGTAPNTEKRENMPTKSPDHEQGREHTPNVDAQKNAADTRRGNEATMDPNLQGSTQGKRDDHKDAEAGDAKRTVAEGQDGTKPGHDAVKPTGNTNTSGNR
ncbi:MAG: hypothetical protein IPL52_15155 [Flavobacteriales bacterium]|nr:hypothetical protein [Flavobacteriales bacterium]